LKTALVFLVVIGAPLFYLWEHACSFGQCQRIAQLQEERRRMIEVCDSLQARVTNARSDYRIGDVAQKLGLESKYAMTPKPGPAAEAGSAASAIKAPSMGPKGAAKRNPNDEIRMTNQARNPKPEIRRTPNGGGEAAPTAPLAKGER